MAKAVVRKTHSVEIPELTIVTVEMYLVGDRPLMVNNKLNVAQELHDIYSGPGGKAAHPKAAYMTDDEKYERCFYVMPDSPHPAPHPKGHYGVPTSGIKKCLCSAIRATGINDNTTVGQIQKSFWIMEDGAGLSQIEFGRLERDVRMVSKKKGGAVPEMRVRPVFHDWSIKCSFRINPMVIGADQLFNLALHAGQYIGLCEMRAEKMQGTCGGFTAMDEKHYLQWRKSRKTKAA